MDACKYCKKYHHESEVCDEYVEFIMNEALSEFEKDDK